MDGQIDAVAVGTETCLCTGAEWKEQEYGRGCKTAGAGGEFSETGGDRCKAGGWQSAAGGGFLRLQSGDGGAEAVQWSDRQSGETSA